MTSPPPPDLPLSPQRVKWWHWLLLAAILTVALGLRVHRISAESFWVDELYSLEFSSGHCYADLRLPRDQVIESPPRLTPLDHARPTWHVLTTLEDDQHPPVYYLLLRLWREAFGSTEAACRSLSVAASIAAILLLFDVGRLLLTPGAALWACALMAVAQPQIWHAQDARSYVLLAALILGITSAVLRIERYGMSIGRGVALVLLPLATVLTHYFAVAACLVLGLYVVVRFPRPLRNRTLTLLAVSAALFCATWLPFAVEQLRGYAFNNDWLKDRDFTWPAWFRRIAVMPFRLFASPPKQIPFAAFSGAILLLLPALRLRRVPGLVLPFAILTTWFAVLSLLDILRSTHQMDFTRYVVGASPALYLLSAGLLWDRRGWLRHVLPASLALYCTLSLYWTYDVPYPELRRLGQFAARHVHPDDLLVYHTPGTGDWYASVLHLAVDHYAPDVSAPILFATRPLDPAALDRARRGGGAVWAVIEQGSPSLPTDLVPGFHVTRIELLWGVGHLYRLQPLTPPSETDTSSTPTTRGT